MYAVVYTYYKKKKKTSIFIPLFPTKKYLHFYQLQVSPLSTNSEEVKAVSSNLKYVQIRGFQAPTQQRLQYPEVPPICLQLHK